MEFNRLTIEGHVTDIVTIIENGELEIEKMETLLNTVSSNEVDNKKSIKVLYDLRKAKVLVKNNYHINMTQITNQYSKYFDSIKTALLVDDPIQTVFAILYSEAKAMPNVKREVFSTSMAAKRWLME